MQVKILKNTSRKIEYEDAATLSLLPDGKAKLTLIKPSYKELFYYTPDLFGTGKTLTPDDGVDYLMAFYRRFKRSSVIIMFREESDTWFKEE